MGTHVWVCFADLVDSGRNLGQVLPDAGHAELDLVADALLRTFGWMCSRDAEEAQQQDPDGDWTELLLREHHSSGLETHAEQTLTSGICVAELR